MRSPTQNSLKLLREEGYTAAVVEFWNSFVARRQDLFGIFDIIALRDNEVLFVQTTSLSNVSHRVKKITDSEHLGAIRKAGVRMEVHGWAKRKIEGRVRWTCARREDVS